MAYGHVLHIMHLSSLTGCLSAMMWQAVTCNTTTTTVHDIQDQWLAWVETLIVFPWAVLTSAEALPELVNLTTGWKQGHFQFSCTAVILLFFILHQMDCTLFKHPRLGPTSTLIQIHLKTGFSFQNDLLPQ